MPSDDATERPTIAAETCGTGDDLLTLDALGDARRYELGATIGRGGMGEVRACTDRRMGRQIAMKVIRRDAQADNPEMRARFLREARVQGQTEHPSIVPVYDVGKDETGALYFTMRRLSGSTLEGVLRGLQKKTESVEREFPRNKLLSAFGSACLAVHFAHTRGILHCDLKPDNIMLGSFGELYVLDWGLATRSVPRDPDAAYAEPERRAVGGTPGYMAPEQIVGEAPDARSDVYALGAVLYEILTLEPMHRGESPVELFKSTLEGGDRATVGAGTGS